MTKRSRATSGKLRRARALSGVLLLLTLLLTAACASSKAFHEGEKLAEAENWDQAVLAFSKALSQSPGNTQYKVALARARLRASQEHFDRGKKYLAAGQLEPAMAELQQTVFLDPNNQYAADELNKAIKEYQRRRGEEQSDIEKMKERARLAGRVTPRLNPKSNIPIVLKFKDETAKNVYDALSKASGINFLYDERVDLNKKVNIDLVDVNFAKALEILMAQNKHFYKIWDENTIMIADDNQQKHKEYDDLVIQTFYLSNADVKDVQVLLRSLLDARQLAQNDRLNAITIRDTPDRVQVAEKIIEANDKAKAELVVDVQLLEFNRNLLQNLGIDLTGGSSGGTGKSLTIGYTGGTSVPLNNLGLLNQLGNYSVGPIPAVILNFLLTDADAQVIAKPQLRVSEGEKASVKIGDRIPIPTTTFNTTQTVGGTVVPITSFTYQNVGINIDLEPRVHHNKEVTLKLKVELSSLAGSVNAGGGVTQPIIGTREIETQIRLKDGETNLLAGLIRREERTSLSGVPGLTQIPVLKRLFGSTETTVQQTDIVLTLTPHIIRIPDITATDLKPLWIGTDQDVGLRGVSRTSPFGAPFEPDGSEEESREEDAAGASLGVMVPGAPLAGRIEPQPAEPGTPPSDGFGSKEAISKGEAPPTPQPPAQAFVTFSPTSFLSHAGDTIQVQVLLNQGTRVGSAPFHVAYDPKILQFVKGEEGEFLKRDGASTVFNAQASSLNEVFVALARLGVPTGVSGNGVLCTLTFQAVATGNTTLSFKESSVLDPSGLPLPAQFGPVVQVSIQ
ncbi:MAG TPA: cohesin domain-containing protein [Candidatus Polarisedimenticolia bacterium]|jgi:general secretion pathway protein D|nr:cohesin domain-containing protein [Candidatus Polarisedimenticolia bacterium]